MLTVSALMSCTANSVASVLTPSRNSCMIRTAVGRYRFDPYRAAVIPMSAAMFSALTPKKGAASPLAQKPTAPASPVPHALKAATAAAAAIAVAVKTAAPTRAAASASAAIAATATTTSAALASAPRYASIKFKHETCFYLAPFKVSVGDVVVVEGDRGHNIGQVARITADKPSFPVACKVLRRCTAAERSVLDTLRAKEVGATRSAQTLADANSLGIRIVDTEFQSDMNKLTVYFATKCPHVDFRKLQRGLFREFRCRIWMVNWNELKAASE